MNKTIIININGIIFHIEEDAYEVLKKYMTDVKRHFMDSADSLEITTDIENRIAEMFSEILHAESKQVIIEQDVNDVIGKMGTVADFASAEDEGTAGHNTPKYQNINRRLFRDGEDHLAGGVCAGIANYFGVQPVWIRLAFAIAFCFYGTGLLLYIILWIVVPRAVTRTDRMAMKGEPLDLQGFKRNFEDELKGVKGHAAALHLEARPFIYRTRDFAGDFFSHLRSFLVEAGSILLKVLGIAIMLICFALLIALLVMVFAFFAYGAHNIDMIFPFSIVKHEYTVPFIFGCFFLLALPLLGLALKTSRIVFNRAPIGRTAGYTLLLVWIAALCTVVYYSVQAAAEFQSGGKISQTINIKPAPGNVYHLKMNDIRYLSSQDSAKLDIKHAFANKIILDDDRNNGGFDDVNGRNVTITIEKSDVPQPVLIERFNARGSNYNNALMNARNIIYRFTQTDSLLLFDRHIQLSQRSPWRQQTVSLILKIPIGFELVIDKNLYRYLYGVDFYSCQTKTTLEHSRTAPFMMAEDGLECYIPKMLP